MGSYEDLRNAIQNNLKVKRQTALGEKVEKLLKKVEKKEESKMVDVVKKQESGGTNDPGATSCLNQTSFKANLSPSKSKRSWRMEAQRTNAEAESGIVRFHEAYN